MGESLVINGKEYGCPIYVTLEMVGGKWKVAILWHLAEGTTRFGELKRQLRVVTQKMLTQQLRELERDGLVNRMVYAEVPPRVEYSLTTDGQSILPVLQSMFDWGKKWVISKAAN
jgi:DNA-binding HxlR family transcriptional regulator